LCQPAAGDVSPVPVVPEAEGDDRTHLSQALVSVGADPLTDNKAHPMWHVRTSGAHPRAAL
jgi:hypothetical protein